MRIIFWHGYLLTGTGSNIFTANVVRTFRKEGHDVFLLCQHKRSPAPPFIDEEGDFAEDNLSYQTVPLEVVPASGRCRLIRPAIGGLLPVYVYDKYPHIEAKRFVDLTDEELERYIETNVTALVTAIEDHRPDAIFIGHEVMGPYIAKLACEKTGTKYGVQLHGSALEYAVKEQERYVAYAKQGLGAAHRVIGGSNYMLKAASSVVGGWEDRGVVVNPGGDVELFKPRAAKTIEEPIVSFVGKLIPQKGVHNFIAALPLVSGPGFRSVIVGGGKFGDSLKQLVSAFRSGDFDGALEAVTAEASPEMTSALREFLGSAPPGDVYSARAREISVEFLGHLDHDQLSGVLPGFDVMVVSSIVPEAFGMVAAEAAACGVLPITPDHSGIGEVGAALEQALGMPGLLTFDSRDPIRSMAATIERLLQLPAEQRAEMGLEVSKFTRENWAWEVVTRRLLETMGAKG